MWLIFQKGGAVAPCRASVQVRVWGRLCFVLHVCPLAGGGSSFTYTFIRSPERPQRWLALQKHGNLSIFQVAPAAGMLGNGLFQKFHHVVEQERGRGRPSDEAQRWTLFFLACL